MLRILELGWLIFAILGTLFAIYKLFNDGLSEALSTLFFTIVAAVFYFIRKRQRIAMEKENEGVRDASIKS